MAARIHQVDVPRAPLLLEEDGQPLKIYIHPDVPMRHLFISQVEAQCIAAVPGDATHILLDLLPPHKGCSSHPTQDQMGFIFHREARHVLCGYWAQECLRVGGVADMTFWDLSGWHEWQALDHKPGSSTGSTLKASSGPGKKGGPAARKRKRVSTVKTTSMGEEEASLKDVSEGSSYQAAASLASSASVASESLRQVEGSGSSLKAGAYRPRRAIVSVELVASARKKKASINPPNPRAGPETIRADTVESSGSSSIRSIPTSSVSQLASSKQVARQKLQESSRQKLQESSPTPQRTGKYNPSKLGEKSADEIQNMWTFFLDHIHARMGIPSPSDAVMGNLDTVKQCMLTRVHGMWCEARSKYPGRPLDPLSVMISTWKTSREFNLSPFAIRKYYDDFQGRVNADKVQNIPLKNRPPGYPFHDRPPVNPEAALSSIPEWTGKYNIVVKQELDG
ncbi:hypothetical protein BD324DRAFT_652929 [Kockovaella imperatae]|uniref:Uncharacterized protein n=1 Tax=Kockovaella imperatae TaxID=4999 RepID=A0A1Y1U9F4_9TREE|nr:hypothetical protein BD324DRAFT_652929 [Kockovaella imperatae]ORX34661.1 hypothetical protein BD324DRAFT_652929 [Kockovaella imperatae]